ncbi:uncharacterized protein F4822DRAFT_21742 [Hypoxylon trugodes]|uniref:uncharacterized protein n=1 Tax=Hypoxylon trugodes TaxID=326681 RepID=UPI0021985B77|nr:uncharacterized protein F4822DRAFT_21742 [Hypoxylon trugodes]KAI1393711.1 hypothetical protein F4822DRAFT_21742 [Hypoxylon trugodes]
MSADLFAAFEDAPKPPTSKEEQPKPITQASPFTPNPFSFGFNNAENTSAQIGQHTLAPTQNWGIGPTSRTSQLPSTSGTNNLTSAPPQPAGQSKAQEVKNEEDDDDDGWGDFEVAPNVSQALVASSTGADLSGSTVKKPQDPPTLPRTRVVRASTIDLMTNSLLDFANSPVAQGGTKVSSWKEAPSKQAKTPTPNIAPSKAPQKYSNADPNVLFDADDFDGDQKDDDDFGEFETVASPVQATGDLLSIDSYSSPKITETRASQMLSGLNLSESASYSKPPRSPSFQDRNPFPGLAVSPPLKTKKPPTNEPKPSPVTAWPSIDPANSKNNDGFGDDWDAFDSLPDEKTKPKLDNDNSNWDWDSIEPAQEKSTTSRKPTTASAPKDSSWDWDPIGTKTEKQADSSKDSLPPTNIPPPSILLSVFPQLFEQANTSLYKPVSGQTFSIKNRILSDPKTIDFLRGYLALATVVARIIAGRKLRWHRDKFLAQRMSISAAGSKGMKLAGVDKTQAAHEDREAADVVANWKEHVGRLRSAVAAANSSIKNSVEQLKIPEITESMHIQTEKMVPTAPKSCMVCGLKRNERVAKVDYEVEDSFGEWWVDHWGHLACKRFWLRHENALRQR